MISHNTSNSNDRQNPVPQGKNKFWNKGQVVFGSIFDFYGGASTGPKRPDYAKY